MTWRAKPLTDSSDSLFAEVAKSHAKRNCLVIGPAGCGKLSLVRGLAALTSSRARKFLFDWEVELDAQRKLLGDLGARLKSGVKDSEVWVHRKIHLVTGHEHDALMSALRTQHSSDTAQVLSYATCEPDILAPNQMAALECIFPVRISLGEGGFVHGAFDAILSRALISLEQKYGRRVTTIEPEAIHVLEDMALSTHLSVMLSALERAFVLGEGTHLHLQSLLEARK